METVYTDTPKEIKPGFQPKPDYRILMFCGSGYSFGEYFKPIIEKFINNYSIEFLQGDYRLTTSTKESLEDFSRNQNFSCRTVHVLGRNDSVFNYHQGLWRLMKILSKKPFDLLIVSTDCNLIDRYLIKLARSKGVKIVIVHANLMHWEVLRNYRNQIGVKDKEPLPHELKGKIRKLQNSPDKIGLIFSYIFKRLASIRSNITLGWQKFENQYLWPAIFAKAVFRENKYDRFNFTSGRADQVILYDPIEVAALKRVAPGVKNICLVKHPSTYYSADPGKGVTRKLLVLLTSYSGELPEKQFSFWIESIKKISALADLNEIHLRFHPRTDTKLVWPKKLITAISNLGLKVEVIDSDKDFLAESAANYIGVVGTISGSIRTARASCKGFVIGLLKAGGDSLSLLDQEWMLGASEGISWVNSAEEIRARQLKPFSFSEIRRPTIAEEINKVLCLIKK